MSTIDDQARNWTEDLPPPPGTRWLDSAEPLGDHVVDNVSKSLNIGHRYADHLTPSVKEHVQNWRDQICKLGGRLFAADCSAGDGQQQQFDPFAHLNLSSSSLAVRGGGGHHDRRWAFECAGRTLGWLVLQRPRGASQCRLYLCNYVTVLSLDILTLGHSDKRDVEWMAGFFGEGVKVEINRLAQARAEVRYYTGPHQWTFFYEQQGVDRVLSVRQERIERSSWERLPKEMRDQPWHTLIVIDKLPAADLFDPDHFVFLHQQPRQELVCDDGYRVLLDARLTQKVYAQGIFIRATADPIPWGFDYRGRKPPPELKMGRDRDQVDTDGFFRRISSMYSVKNAPINGARLSAVFTDKLYDYLAYDPPQGGRNHRTEPRAPWRSFAGADHLAMSKALLEVFTRRHGTSAVPTDSKASQQPSKDDDEAGLLSVKLVEVQENLLEWLRLSPECPTLDSVWQRRAKEVLELPEFIAAQSEPRPPYSCPIIPLEGAMAALAVSLRDMVEAFFAPHIRRHQVRFKHFASHMATTKRRLLKLEWEKVTYYILNDRLIAPEVVHVAQKKADSSFSCPGGACGCVRDCIVGDLLELLSSSDARAVERKMRRKLLALYDNNKIAPPAPDVLPPPDEGKGKEKEEEGGLVPRRRAKRPREQALLPAADPPQVLSNKPPSPPPLAGRDQGGSVEPIRGVADSAPDADLADVQRCMNSTGPAAATDAIRHPGRPEASRVVFDHRCAIPRQSELKIKRSSVGRVMGIRLWVEEGRGGAPSHPLQRTPAVVTDELVRFAQVLALLCRDAFALSLEHVNIVWEDSERVAFNLNSSSLFFNLRYAEAWLAKSASPLELMDYWYPVVCHELAHNMHADHGAAHTRVMGALVSAKMAGFCQLRRTVERSFNSWRAFDGQRPP